MAVIAQTDVPTALTIAGSDSSGGAGIQADLRGFNAAGVHGASVITLVTAQGTRGIRKVAPLAPDLVRAQLEAVLGCSTIAVNSTHHQAVGKVAGVLRVSARSADGVVEALELKDPKQLPFLMTVQFHPERLYDRYPVFQKLFNEFIRASRPKRNKKA